MQEDLFKEEASTDQAGNKNAAGRTAAVSITTRCCEGIMPESSGVMQVFSGAEMQMTSLEIAELVNKRHDNVKRTIERLAKRGAIQLPPKIEVENSELLSPNNKTQVYIFKGERAKNDCLTVVAKLSPVFAADAIMKSLSKGKDPQSLTLHGNESQTDSELIRFFDYQQQSVRVAIIDNSPWFVAKDVCNVLGLENVSRALSSLDDDEIQIIYSNHAVFLNITNSKVQDGSTKGHGGARSCSLISESGLYALVLKSRRPEAKAFRKWITSEVLPEIARTGRYGFAPALPNFTDPAEAAIAWAKEYREKKALEEKIQADAPKVGFYDTVIESDSTLDMGKVAKVLNMGIGRNGLFALLRRQGILNARNEPYQQYVKAGWFRLIESSYQTRNGKVKVGVKTVVFQKGVDGIRRLLSEAGYTQPSILVGGVK